MATPIPPARPGGRETRLLLVTIAVSAVLLLVLARFRFPDQRRAEEPRVSVGQPFDRMVARTEHEELAQAIARVDAEILPAVVLVEIARPAGDLASPSADRHFAPAVRIRPDMAVVAAIPPEQVFRDPSSGAPFDTIARDDVRGLAVIRVSGATSSDIAVAPSPASSEFSPQYVAAVEGSLGTPTVRPLFLGRVAAVSDAAWDEPLASCGGPLAVEPGSFLFTLEGRLLGLVVRRRELPALVPAGSLLAAARRLADGKSRLPGDIGVQWQALTPSLARATRADHGVLVAEVDPSGPAAEALRPGDVVQQVRDHQVSSIESAYLAVAAVAPGEPLRVHAVRLGASLDVSLVAREAPGEPPAPSPSDDLGLMLAPGRFGALVSRVMPGSLGDRAGLRKGDLIVSVDGEPVVRPASIFNAWNDGTRGTAWLLVVRRPGTQLVTAIEKP